MREHSLGNSTADKYLGDQFSKKGTETLDKMTVGIDKKIKKIKKTRQ